MITIFTILAIVGLTILAIAISRLEDYITKKKFNNGICPHCGIRMECFDVAHYGDRGYKCLKCSRTIWIPGYSRVDEEFEENDLLKRTFSSKIEELIYDKDSIVIFDIDGVLAKYEFGERNHNCCSDEEWDNNIVYYSATIYDSAKPVREFQELINEKRYGSVYTCSVAKGYEQYAKVSFVRRFYNIPEENILFVESKEQKLEALKAIRAKNKLKGHDIPDEKYIMVDDTVKVLTNIQDNSDFSTCHVSSFLN